MRAPAGRAASQAAAQRDGGYATAELACVMPALCLVVAALLFLVGAVCAQVRCVDAARAGVRAAARGEATATVQDVVAATAPGGASVSVRSVDGDRVAVQVTAVVAGSGRLGLPAVTVTSTALAAREDVQP